MVGSINKVILVGNVGNQPEIKTTQSTGEALAIFSIATSEKWKDKNSGEQKERTDWHKIVVFAPGLVRVVKEYINKGSKIYIEGKMQTRDYEGTDGIRRYTTEVILTQYNSNLVLLDPKKNSMDFRGQNSPYSLSNEDTKQVNDNQDTKKNDLSIEDIPF